MAGVTWVRNDLHLLLGDTPAKVSAYRHPPSSSVHLSVDVVSEDSSAQVRVTFTGTREDLGQLLAEAAEQLALLPPEPPTATDAAPADGKAGR